MPRLSWVFVGRTGDFVGFVMLRLICGWPLECLSRILCFPLLYINTFLHTRRGFPRFSRADKSYLACSCLTGGMGGKQMATCCRCTGCVGGRVALSLKHWELTSHTTSNFNVADVSVYGWDSLVGTPTWKSNAPDQKICKKKNLSWLFGADIEIGTASWCQTLTLRRIFLSAHHTHERVLWSKLNLVGTSKLGWHVKLQGEILMSLAYNLY